jgi:hypothetical protein
MLTGPEEEEEEEEDEEDEEEEEEEEKEGGGGEVQCICWWILTADKYFCYGRCRFPSTTF